MVNEKRLIDPKKAMYLAEYSGLYDFDLSALETLLDEPCITVDAVEVVRCKDCKAFVRNSRVDTDRGDCYRYGIGCVRIKKIDDFCSYGERREGE